MAVVVVVAEVTVDWDCILRLEERRPSLEGWKKGEADLYMS